MKIDARELILRAIEAREASYCPYSDIAVGAALLTKSGKVYLGQNIENASYSPTVCAERVALFKAISEGEREFAAIAIVGGPVGEPLRADFPPCGVCRQVMGEFCDKDFRVIWGDGEKITERTLAQILPDLFDKNNL